MTKKLPVVGVLALQGDYQKHLEILDSIDVRGVEVRFAPDFEKIDRLIIPGGETTVMTELLDRLSLREVFTSYIRSHAVWGTCAGMILLSARVNDDSVIPLGAIDISVDRNGYGRQVFSTVARSALALNGAREELDLVFIRAPRVTRVGAGVTTLLKCGDDPVLLSQENILVSAFHPELTGSTLLHEYFVHKFTAGI
jgi:5'-phosphate synthase pdxT subunit